jgi:hypothetical protein
MATKLPTSSQNCCGSHASVAAHERPSGRSRSTRNDRSTITSPTIESRTQISPGIHGANHHPTNHNHSQPQTHHLTGGHGSDKQLSELVRSALSSVVQCGRGFTLGDHGSFPWWLSGKGVCPNLVSPLLWRPQELLVATRPAGPCCLQAAISASIDPTLRSAPARPRGIFPTATVKSGSNPGSNPRSSPQGSRYGCSDGSGGAWR